MSFIEARLLDDLAYGFSGGPTWRTLITTLRNRHERRNVQAARPQHKFQGSFDRRDRQVLDTLLQTFNATYGAAYGFRFKNWLDYQASGERIAVGTGDPQTAQLTKAYAFGGQSVSIPVRKPVAATVQLFANGAPIASTASGATGTVWFVAPAGHVVTWSGEFDLPVRFENDEFSATIETVETHTVDIRLVEDMSA